MQIEQQLNNLCKQLYNGRYKIEYEDLYQQAWLYYLEYGNISDTKKALYKYINDIRKDPVSTAISLDYLMEYKHRGK